MYHSGVWRGFWHQEGFGRQSMEQFELRFQNGEVFGGGIDIVGRFTIQGEYDPNTGSIRLKKQYLGKHTVYYRGEPDGEGCILGTWSIDQEFFGIGSLLTGPFLMKPEIPKPTGDEPIIEIRPR